MKKYSWSDGRRENSGPQDPRLQLSDVWTAVEPSPVVAERRFTMPIATFTESLGSTAVSKLLGKHAEGYFDRCAAVDASDLAALSLILDVRLGNLPTDR